MESSSEHREGWGVQAGKLDITHVEHIAPTQEVPFARRLQHFTWAWFTLPLSTAGIALLLGGTPHRFPVLTTIGKIFFILATVLFVAAVIAIGLRFVLYPRMLHCSFVHPTESLFFPTLLLSVANLLECVQIDGTPSCGPWLIVAIRMIFWIYMACAFISTIFQYLYLFSAPTHRLTIQSMTPAWILPVFPVMLGSVIASITAPKQPPMSSLTIIVAGITCIGLGWMVAFLMSSIYLQRLMAPGLPAPNLRPGMFFAVGPPSFTALALINLAQALPAGNDRGYCHDNKPAIGTLQTLADFSAVFLWTLAFWVFCITLVAVMRGINRMFFISHGGH